MEICHIVPVGPARIGKTTLVHSVMEALAACLDRDAGSLTASLRPQDREEIERTTRALRGACGVHADALVAPTSAPASLEMQIGGRRAGLLGKVLGKETLSLCFHDYPGALMEDLPAFTREVLPLAEAEVLLVPVDASLLMESATGREEVAAQALHRMSCVEELIVEWEKGRARTGGGLLIFAPIRCERFFGDNGMTADAEAAARLQDRICGRFFASILDIVTFFGDSINAMYVPVDTIGRCRLKSGNWATGTSYGFEASYEQEAAPSPFGCEMIALLILDYCLKLRLNRGANRTLEEMEKKVDSLVAAFRDQSGYSRARRIC